MNERAVLTRDLPRIFLVTGSIERIESGTTVLSPAVQLALDKVVETVSGIVEMERYRTRAGSMLSGV